jgi:thiamine-monophosphate kinase
VDRVSDIGEFGLIARLTSILPRPANVIVGVGDDAAVLQVSSSEIIVATCDMFVEGVHFDLNTCTASQVGWRAMTASLSDIAAMGCRPLFATISIAVPQDTPVGTIVQIYNGLANAARPHAVAIVGGDTVRSPAPIVLDVSAIGEPDGERYLTRSGARDGDLIAVTGYPGQSAAGLEIIMSAASRGERGDEDLVRAHLEPQARVEHGLSLAQTDAVTAAIDLSDGLVQDLGHICEMSKLGGLIDLQKLPISPPLSEYCKRHSENPVDMCLSGGEDYELLFTIRKDREKPLIADWCERFDIPMTIIGYMTAEFDGVRFRDGDRIVSSDRAGYDHFRKRDP